MLTPKQRELLLFIQDTIVRTGIAPSFDEMAAHIGVVSKAAVSWRLNQLVARGFLRRLPHRARAIEVVKPIGATPAAATITISNLADGMIKLLEACTAERDSAFKTSTDGITGVFYDGHCEAFIERMSAVIAEARAVLEAHGIPIPVRTCRKCGCTDDRACVYEREPGNKGPCWWVETDLCTACVKGA